MENLVDILYEMGIDSAAVGALSMMLGFILVGVAIGGIIGLVLYILKAAGLYAMAKRRNIGGAWLAWIPIGQYWVAGALSDQYKKTVKGKSSANRIVMLILALVGWVFAALAGSAALSSMIQMITAAVNEDMQQLSMAATMLSGGSSLLSLLNSAAAIALFVFWQISLYDIYASSCPKNAVAFLLLGIFFDVTVPFFLFCNRKKDEGMKIPQPVPQPVYDYGTADYSSADDGYQY